MAIPLHFLARYAIPLIVAAVYLGDVDIPQQMFIFDKTERLTDETLSKAKGDGEAPETFDYIIVGAGSAGALLANRLTASGEHQVLLLEAGGDPNPIYDVPNAQPYFFVTGLNNWGYESVKQNKTCAATNGICTYPRGKALGGTSSINGMAYNRAKPKDYDLWANFTGDQSWSWRNILATYNSFEDYHGNHENAEGSRDNHGHVGELYISKIDYLPGIEVVEEALQEKGYPLGDLNGGEDFTSGFSRIDYNIKDGLRMGTYQAFLQPILERPNLHIYRHAQAVKIETETVGGNVRAVGVTYQRHSLTRTAEVRKDVIISAGAFDSPKLLMLSGIGPKEELDRLEIPTVLDLPVGKHLQDHTIVGIVGEESGFTLNTTFDRDHNTTEDLLQYIQNGTGAMNALYYNGGTTAHIIHGNLNSGRNDDRAWPDLRSFISSTYYVEKNRQEFYFTIELIRTGTSGRVTLRSDDPMDKPLIDPNLLEDPVDLERMVDGIEMIMDVFMNSTAFKKYHIMAMEGEYEKCRGLEGRDYWRCYVVDKSTPSLHPTATCRMGPDGRVAVVDSKLRVFGTSNLRVMDASSIPFVTSGNTNLPAMLIGARGAEIILSGE